MKVLVTGANGYIGKRLILSLVSEGVETVCLVRDPARLNLPGSVHKRIRIITGDLLNYDTLPDLPEQLDGAYYLVHSMTRNSRDFHRMEENAAGNFARWVADAKTKQIVYLGGIANDTGLSKHLLSRKNVEKTLGNHNVPVTTLRAAIIIGSGSASFEIIRDLVEKLPVMVAPRWLNTRCQPIAVGDVIRYLIEVVRKPSVHNRTYDIGGPDILTYREMLLGFAKVRGHRRWIHVLPVLSPRLSSYWLYLITTTTYTLAKTLVDSMKNEVICRVGDIREVDRTQCLPYPEAIRQAFTKIEQNEVFSRWTDAIAGYGISPEFHDYLEVPTYGCFMDERIVRIAGNPDDSLAMIFGIGGKRGWYHLNRLWELRGFLDRMVGGSGLRRGRRDEDELSVGDALDFWRVIVSDRKNRRLLLYAEMKMPGEAWLEFHIQKNDDGYQLIQRAVFRPRGISGRLYWYSVYPFHHFIFSGMAAKIARGQFVSE